MPNSFMQKHSRPSWTEYDFHFASRSFTGIELNDGLSGRFVGKVLGRFLLLEVLKAHTSATSGISARGVLFVFRYAEDAHPSKWLRV